MLAYFLSFGLNDDRSSTIEKKIKEVVPTLVRVRSFEDIRQDRPTKDDGAKYVLVAGPSNTNAYFDGLLSMVERARGQFFFILISEDISASDYKRLIRTGSADWASAARAPQETLDIIARRQVALKPVALGDRAPPVAIAFVPSAGGVGNTTLVAEVALNLKHEQWVRSARSARLILISRPAISAIISTLNHDSRFRRFRQIQIASMLSCSKSLSAGIRAGLMYLPHRGPSSICAI